MTRSLQGSVVLVTAGTSGLGLCVAEKLIQSGASVVINYASNEERAHDAFVHLNELAAKTFSQNTGPRCLKIKADVTKKEGIQELVNLTVSAMGRIDAVVSNAGWTKFANFHDIDDNVDEEVWDRCYAANVKSHMFLCHAVKKYLEEAQGAFVMTASVAGVKPSGSSIAYSVTKAAQIHLAKTLAMVMAPSVRVNSVSPSFMETNWIANMPQSKIDDAREKTLLKQIAKVEDVAEQIILLIKSESVTGSNVIVDSGFSI
ncbi:related to cis-1,2-dihydro-1,2-dihydroxynaphthalene dehydrogenase [Fusarium fujikuroi]|nr:related to cis-1,2-dihydro-1,2-dihydroxynaphthalene dehydrogenase [Fusarium fujikuroi]